ncbi:MAG: GNAT family N-acetyltransferase [Methanobacteriaceae archaeon]|jgi:ribosomal protein S18 acetylase RimI-like enzyme|nr:GNAT family N-acetyltransferase [Methanobacteriaceae archaeon]MDD4593684.1 GNAT family N-acetyltransferase [Methanobacteriaceae archaeon]
MIFEKFNPEIHDYHKLASLTYDVDFRTYEKVFKNKDIALFALEDEMLLNFKKTSNENYSFYVILNDYRKIMGMVKISKGETHNLIQDSLFLFKNLRFSEASKLSYISFLDRLVLSKVNNDDLYIGEIAINPENRGQGLGKLVINKIIKYAKNEGYKRVVLDADFRNLGALKLYESLGFSVFNQKSSKILDPERGMYNLEYIL